MGLGVARVGDTTEGYCSCNSHGQKSGTVIDGVENVHSNGLPTGRITSIVRASCGHESPIISGSETVWTNGVYTARITSIFGEEGDCYTGYVIDGSSNIIAG